MKAVVYNTTVYNMEFNPEFFLNIASKYGEDITIIFCYKGAYGALLAYKVKDIVETFKRIFEAKKVLDYTSSQNLVKIFWDELMPMTAKAVELIEKLDQKENRPPQAKPIGQSL